MSKETIISDDQLAFSIFCIENVARAKHVTGTRVYDALTKDSDLLYSYVIPSYDILHTQSRTYIVDDVLSALQNKGVSL